MKPVSLKAASACMHAHQPKEKEKTYRERTETEKVYATISIIHHQFFMVGLPSGNHRTFARDGQHAERGTGSEFSAHTKQDIIMLLPMLLLLLRCAAVLHAAAVENLFREELFSKHSRFLLYLESSNMCATHAHNIFIPGVYVGWHNHEKSSNN